MEASADSPESPAHASLASSRRADVRPRGARAVWLLGDPVRRGRHSRVLSVLLCWTQQVGEPRGPSSGFRVRPVRGPGKRAVGGARRSVECRLNALKPRGFASCPESVFPVETGPKLRAWHLLRAGGAPGRPLACGLTSAEQNTTLTLVKGGKKGFIQGPACRGALRTEERSGSPPSTTRNGEFTATEEGASGTESTRRAGDLS